MSSYSNWFTNVIIDTNLHEIVLSKLHWFTNVTNTWTAFTLFHKCNDECSHRDYQTICQQNATLPNSLHHSSGCRVRPDTSLCTLIGNLLIPMSIHPLVFCPKLQYSTLEYESKNVCWCLHLSCQWVTTPIYFGKHVLKTKRRSDSVLWQKPLYQQKCQKGKVKTRTTQQKSSIKQRLRTDLGRSVGVTTATQLVWLTCLRAHLPTPRISRVIQKDTHLKMCK